MVLALGLAQPALRLAVDTLADFAMAHKEYSSLTDPKNKKLPQQRERDEDAADIPIYGPNIVEGQTVSDLSSFWFKEMGSLRRKSDMLPRTPKGLGKNYLDNAWDGTPLDEWGQRASVTPSKPSVVELKITTDPGTKASVTSIKSESADVTVNQSLAP